VADLGFEKGGFKVGAAAFAALPRGVWGHAPQKIFGNMDALRCSLVHFGVETESRPGGSNFMLVGPNLASTARRGAKREKFWISATLRAFLVGSCGL